MKIIKKNQLKINELYGFCLYPEAQGDFFIQVSGGEAFLVVINLDKNSENYLKFAEYEISKGMLASVKVPYSHGYAIYNTSEVNNFFYIECFQGSSLGKPKFYNFNSPEFRINWPFLKFYPAIFPPLVNSQIKNESIIYE